MSQPISAADEEAPSRPGLAGQRIEQEFDRVLDTLRKRVEEAHAQMPA